MLVDDPATEARITTPSGIDVAADGSIYLAVAENRVRRVDPDGIITTVAGDGSLGSHGDGGPAIDAGLYHAWDVEVGPDGSYYVSQYDRHRVRRIDADGIITRYAGSGGAGFSGDGGPAELAQLNEPRGLAVGPDGSLYIADRRNHRIRRVGPDGIITTVAGSQLYCNSSIGNNEIGRDSAFTGGDLDRIGAVHSRPNEVIRAARGILLPDEQACRSTSFATPTGAAPSRDRTERSSSRSRALIHAGTWTHHCSGHRL